MITSDPVQDPELREYSRGRFLISTDRRRLDLDSIHAFLAGCYWAKGIPKHVVARSIQHSLCFGVYKQGKQIGFARVISDYATYAYIADVYVEDKCRGQGLGKWMMECIMQHPLLQGLRRWSLLTRDAHGLYQHFGFRSLKAPERWMEIHQADAYEPASVAEETAEL